MSQKARLLCGILAVFACSVVSADATEGGGAATNSLPTIKLRTGEHPSFDRVVFDAPRGVTYKIDRQGAKVTVRFSIAAKILLTSSKLSRAKAFAVAEGGDGTTPLAITFWVSPKATLKDFMSDASVVVDVTGGMARPEPDARPVEAPQPPSPAVAENVPSEDKLPLEQPVQEAQTAKEMTIAEAEVRPPEGKGELSTETKERAEPSIDNPEEARRGETQEEPPVPKETEEIKEIPAPNWPPASVGGLDAKAIEAIESIIDEQPPAPVAVLDPKIPTGTAIFARAGYVTILFDRKLVGDSLIASPAPRVKLEPFVLPKATGFRIAIPDHVSVRATRKETAWEIYLVRETKEVPLTTEFYAQPSFALGARLLLPTGDPPEPLLMRDPVVGDDLIILPLREAGAFTVRRRLSDFQVVPAAQGLVVKPWHEKVTARIVPDGIEISSEGGLKLSPLKDMGISSKNTDKSRSNAKILFDFERWRGRQGETFTLTRHKLMQTIVDVNADERILARLDLARFYFAHGMGPESLAILGLIAQSLPEIETHPDFLAVRGGSYLLTGQTKAGLADLSHASLKDQPDVVLWRAIGSALSRDWVAAQELFSLSIDALERYPEPLRTRFMLLAVEAAIANDNDKIANEWLSRIEQGDFRVYAEPAVFYLKGVLHSKAGRADHAEKLWRRVAKTTDRLYKIRAELALVDLGVATKSLTPKQAVDRLEGLRFAWRGDDLEFDILKRLGGYYLEAHEFKSGFHILAQALRLFPGLTQASSLRADMVKTFQDVFLTDLGSALNPIEALALYTDYKYLIPSGEEGNAVRKNLAERLVDVDLLDPATKLFEEIIKNTTKAEEKARMTTRLAGVHLLDHKAESALSLLDESKNEASGLPANIKDEQQLLRARALSELGKYQEALAVLPSSGGKDSLLLRADMAFRAHNWGDATKALNELVGLIKKTEPLTEEQAQWLIHTAVSMAQQGDLEGLDRLAETYGEMMDKTKQASLFRVITRPEKTTQLKDIYAAQNRLSEVDMFRGVLDSYRKDKKK